MTLEDIEQQLANLVACGDPAFAAASHNVLQILQQVQASQLSDQDLKELLQDVQRSIAIIQDASRLAFKEQLNNIINAILAIKGLVP